jgi:peroxiredoxin
MTSADPLTSSPARRALYLALGIAALTASAVILIDAGLPARATYTGFIAEGQRVAPELNALAPPIDQPTVDGAAISLADLRGQPVIINFWATWCGPCRTEMVDLQRLYERYGENGLSVVAVNIGEDAATIRNWQTEHGLTYDLVLDPDSAITTAYRLRGQPSTYIVSPRGIITQIYYGPVSIGDLSEAIRPFIAN